MPNGSSGQRIRPSVFPSVLLFRSDSSNLGSFRRAREKVSKREYWWQTLNSRIPDQSLRPAQRYRDSLVSGEEADLIFGQWNRLGNSADDAFFNQVDVFPDDGLGSFLYFEDASALGFDG